MVNIKVNKLKKGQHVLLETKECIFDLEILTPSKGAIKIRGGKRFLEPTKATLVGVFGREMIEDEDKLIHKFEIQQNIGIEIQYQDKDNITSDFVTSPVLSAKVYGKDWEYEVWSLEENNKRLAQSLDEARARLRVQPAVTAETPEEPDDE